MTRLRWSRARRPAPATEPAGAARTDAETAVRGAFTRVLERDADDVGLAYYTMLVLDGMTESDLEQVLASTEEFRLKEARRQRDLPDLVDRHPDRYATLMADDGSSIPTFLAEQSADLDWIEGQIIANGYYEQPGVWGFEIDTDKRLMAELIAMFEPQRVVEVGCSSGAVLDCLARREIDVLGIDISLLAKSKASALVRDRIQIGDIVELALDERFDVAFGLDVFEHLHPDKLDAFIGALVDLIDDGGLLVVNVPAFGRDEVFGEVFPIFLAPWREDAERGRRFRHLQVDEDGYPMHGHLVWATTGWWVQRFEHAGIHRAPALERAVHAHYDRHFDRATPARRSLYVFTKGTSEGREADLIRLIGAKRSLVLEELGLS